MRKLVILCLAVGLALASSEQWIGGSGKMQIPNPDPQPGVFPFTPTLFLDGTDTLKYDDNMVGNGWGSYTGGGGWGMKFISPGDNVTLAWALMNIGSGTPGGTQAGIRVLQDDGPGGAPGSVLFSDTVDITMGTWNLIPMSVQIVASNFYIFYQQIGALPNAPYFSIDANNNAPSHRKWSMDEGGGFAEDNTHGDWMIRAVLDWTPQDTNASAVWFSTNMTTDTLPNINYQIRATIKNMGSDTLPAGTPVRLSISGPNSYAYDDTMLTSAGLKHGAIAQMNFAPAWHIPPVEGAYNIKVWTEAAGEKWPADDTISYDLDCTKWSEYFSQPKLYWISPAGPEKATLFDPADFGLDYPISLKRVRTEFYKHPDQVWTDTSFQFFIYGDDGYSLLYESDTFEAPTGQPGAPRYCDIEPPVEVASGTFYVAVAPIGMSGPNVFSDSCAPGGHSYYGTPGGWAQYTSGEWFISAAAQGPVGVEEGLEPRLNNPSLRITNYPNPVTDQVTLKWQVPSRMPVSVNLYDATGRMVRNLFAANDKAGVGTLTVDTRGMAAGIYLVRLETAKGSATRKLVIDR